MTTASVVQTGPSADAPGAPGTAQTAGLAVASLVAGILGLCTAGLGGIAGMVLGIVALRKIGRSGGALRGRGLAIAGLIASVCTLVVWVLAAGIGGGVYFYDRTRMEESRRSYEVNQIRTLLSEVEAALNRYQDDIGHPPTIDEGGLRALLRKPQDQQVESKWKGPYLRRSPEEMPLDPWGHRLNYEPPPSSAGTPYRLWSSGPDGISGTPDDLSFESGESEMAPVSAPGR